MRGGDFMWVTWEATASRNSHTCKIPPNPAAWRMDCKPTEDEGWNPVGGCYSIRARRDCSLDHDNGLEYGNKWMGNLLEVESVVLINRLDVRNEGKKRIRNDYCLNDWV